MKRLLAVICLMLSVVVLGGAALPWALPNTVIVGGVCPNCGAGSYFSDSYDVQPIDGNDARVVVDRGTLCNSYNVRVIVEVYDTQTNQGEVIVNWTLTPSQWYIVTEDFTVDHNDIISMGMYLVQTQYPDNCGSNAGGVTGKVDM